MKAYVTSIGETTTDLCVWSLERLGFEVVLMQDRTMLWDKLRRIFKSETEDFLRVDADVVVNKNVLELVKLKTYWWYQPFTFDWWQQDKTHGGIQFIRAEAIPIVREHIEEAHRLDRPESYLYRLQEFHEPRMCVTYDAICGLHGYKQADTERVMNQKMKRGYYDDFDWELAVKLNHL